eukprot:10333865-Alexandrium_andersonii.AAC.1
MGGCLHCHHHTRKARFRRSAPHPKHVELGLVPHAAVPSFAIAVPTASGGWSPPREGAQETARNGSKLLEPSGSAGSTVDPFL